ncbi:MAG: rRNA pseudouridine synthase [Candidatus Pacebacteria bacterium]|nr:rRNA pseudouridine synthase [Candidatus Paceibacterota bacterium]
MSIKKTSVVLQKFIADSGYCSRRKAEELIREGIVKINSEVAVLGTRVDDGDEVVVNGRKIEKESKLLYIALNKPKGYLCTNKTKKGEKSVFSLVKRRERLFVVGRLDKDSRGLVILTNDGYFTYRLTHPSFSHEKEYLVEVSKNINEEVVEKMKKGVDIGEKTKAKAKEVERIGNKKYRVILGEGKKRQIRRMFEVFNCTVFDILRVRIDKYKLGNLKESEWRFIKK